MSSLLRGIGQLSKKTQPFELLSSLAPDFLNNWEATEHESWAELCLVFLAARYSGGQGLPEGFLWQLPAEWPIEGMENWGRLWHSALLDEPLPTITSAQVDDCVNRLDQARSNVEQMLAREHGLFVRLGGIKSRRHRTMINSDIMPTLLSHLIALQEVEKNLRESERQNSAHLLAQLEKLMAGELAEALSEDALVEAYEVGVADAGIHDADPFHRRTSLRVLQDCAEGILDYGRTLAEFWRTQLRQDAEVTREALKTELATLPELTSLGQAALDQIVPTVGSELPEWNQAAAQSLASQQLIHELLTQATYSLRVPHVIGYLTSVHLDWGEMLRYVLDDLAKPVDITGAAMLLMEQGAPNQVLLLTQYLPLDIQKQAQSLKREKEQEIDSLQTELLKAGGSAEDLLGDRELGRWRLVHHNLTLRVAECLMASEQQTQKMQDRSRNLRRTIYNLDEAIFDSKETMPADVYRLVEQGLNLAKRATETEALLGQVEIYLKKCGEMSRGGSGLQRARGRLISGNAKRACSRGAFLKKIIC